MKIFTRKLLAVLMAAAMLCLLIPVGVVSAADNLIANGDFETGDLSGWTNLWGSCTVEMVEGRNGGSALHIQCNAWQMVRQQVLVTPNTDYTLTAWAKDAKSLTFLIKDNADSTNMAQNYTSSGSEWKQYTVSFNSGSNNAVWVSLMGNADGCDAIVDDVVMTKVGGGDAPDAPAADNLFVNGDFETGDANGWQTWQSTAITAEAAKSGSYGAHLQGNGSWGGMLNQTVTVQAGVEYKLSFWLQVNKTGVNVQVHDGAGDALVGAGGWFDVNAAANGRLIEWTFTATDTSVLVNFCGAGNGSAEDAYVDNFVLAVVGGTPVDPDQPDTPDTPDQPYVPVDGNFVNNGALETGDNTGWNLYQSSAVDAAAAYTGDYGLFLQGNGGWGGLGNQLISGLEIGKTYRISLWYKALSAGVNIQLCAGANDTGEKVAYIYGTKTEWTQFAVEFEATTTDVFLTFVGSGTNVAEKMYVDDITLTEVVLGGNDDDPNLKMIDTLLDDVKTQGRTSLVGGTLMLDFSISGIEFELDCSGDVYATFNARKISNSAAEGGVYFTIYVDGEKLARDYCRIASVGETKVLLAEDLPAGKHTFAIYRQSEHSYGEVGVCALSYDGEMLDKPADKDLYIEFIGDSISCGYGNLGNASQGDGSALWSDGTQAYTYLTAQALNADWSNVSWSGLGCKYGYSTTTMQDVYPAQRYNYDANTAYEFAVEPDVIILALGTNDNSIQGDAAKKRAGLVEMLTLVREKNPNAPIVWIHGMMTDGVSAMIEEIVAEFGGAEAGYYACELTRNNAGGGSHPSLAGQQTFADELVAFLQANGLTEVEPDTPDTPDTPVEAEGLLSGGETARMEMTDDTAGLAWRFTINARGITLNKNYEVDLSDATIIVDGVEYKLLEVGALVTNDADVGLKAHRFNHDNLSECTKAVPAVYGNDVTETGLKYAVRVTNIPMEYSDWILYARGYYVYECDGQQVTVYGEIYAANYDNNINTNDGAFDW